jgi:membrane protein YqaA with SNARE-associated domain
VRWWHLHRRLYNWTLSWAYKPSAAWALACISFAESSFFPVPPDVLLMPLALGNPRKWFRYATICTAASVLGGLAGYAIGYGVWQEIGPYVLSHFHWLGLSEANFAKGQAFYQKYDFWAVFAAGLTPIPYKVFTILAGVSAINLPVFIVASIIGRGMRFYLVAGLMGVFGAKVTPFIEKYFNLLSIVFVLLLIGGFMVLKLLH